MGAVYFNDDGVIYRPDDGLVFYTKPPVDVEILIVSAGGGGATDYGSRGGGGGGAGSYIVSNTITLDRAVYNLTVGRGGNAGSAGSNGGNSSFDILGTALGGQGGKLISLGGQSQGSNRLLSVADYNIIYAGGSSADSTGAGGGGGSTSIGTNGYYISTNRYGGGDGGAGKTFNWLIDTSIHAKTGGGGGGGGGGTNGGSAGTNGAPSTYGAGGHGETHTTHPFGTESGSSGIVYVKYDGTVPLYSGGTITTWETKTLHTFITNLGSGVSQSESFTLTRI